MDEEENLRDEIESLSRVNASLRLENTILRSSNAMLNDANTSAEERGIRLGFAAARQIKNDEYESNVHDTVEDFLKEVGDEVAALKAENAELRKFHLSIDTDREQQAREEGARSMADMCRELDREDRLRDFGTDGLVDAWRTRNGAGEG